jgi:hypothetical protein
VIGAVERRERGEHLAVVRLRIGIALRSARDAPRLKSDAATTPRKSQGSQIARDHMSGTSATRSVEPRSPAPATLPRDVRISE